MCGFCSVWVLFGNMCICTYCVFVLFRLCIFILFVFLFNSVSYVLLSSCVSSAILTEVFSVLFPQL